jgi:hypothetical protein
MMGTATSDRGPNDVGELVFARELPNGVSILECLSAAWDEARREARRMYDEWHRSGDADAYFGYRAAQDRADAAQDTLAEFARAHFAQRSL